MSELLELPVLMARGSPVYLERIEQGSGSPSLSGSTVRITPRKTWSNNWAYFAVKGLNLKGTQYSFAVAKASHYNLVAGIHLALWATTPDSDNWQEFDNTAIGASDITFSNNTPFSSDTIYVAHVPMYPFSRTQRLLNEWTQNVLVDETPSSTDFIIGNMTARDSGDGSGRTVPSLPLYAFKISKNSGFSKNKCILVAGNHPSETPGLFGLEGALEWLLSSGDYDAESLLDYCDFYVYPNVNPQGNYSGYFRSSPEDATKDHNRQWGEDVLEDVTAFRAAFQTDTGGAIDVGLDFHSWLDASDTSGDIDVGDSTSPAYVSFLSKMILLDTGFNYVEEALVGSLQEHFKDVLGASLAMAPEMHMAVTYDIADYKLFGKNILKSLSYLAMSGRLSYSPSIGSFLYNGATDRIDWSPVVNLTGQPFTASFWVYRTANPANVYVLCAHDSGNTSYGLILNFLTNGVVDIVRKGTTDYLWYGGNVAQNEWHHVMITSDGGLVSGSVKVWIDGVSKSISFTNGSGAETAHSGSWSTGGRIYSDTRNFAGNIAQLAVWQADYSGDSAMIAGLANGRQPSKYHADTLKFYHQNNTNTLVATPGGTGVADGTTFASGAGNGPTIHYE